MKLRWRYGIVAGLFLAVFSLYPQFKMLYMRGGDWNGHYAYNDIDEVAYAGYLKALIDGRPRKNDPYTGRDDSPENPQPESLFSIQFAAPYTIALPARLLGVDAPWAMTVSGAIAAFLTALVIFWLLGMMTGDSLFAMTGALVVLCGGALFAGEGAIGEVVGNGFSYPYFPGFRRYLPAMAFPAFFLLTALVWKMLTGRTLIAPADDMGARHSSETEDRRSSSAYSISLVVLASLCFGFIVFSYFFVWTAAASWLLIVALLWLAVRPFGWQRDAKYLFGLGVGCSLLLIPYFYLLSGRARTMDDVQMLVHTHMPDVWRTPEEISMFVLVVLVIGICSKIIKWRDRRILFTASLALTQIVVFNQQVLTGQSLQPIHYQVFIGNYIAGLAVVSMVGLLWRQAPSGRSILARLAIASLSLLAVVWGFVECHYTVRVLDDVNVVRDEALPVGRRLAEIGRNDPEALTRVVLYLGLAEGDDLSTLAPQPVLWARHQHVFATVSTAENKQRYYQYLYYTGVDPRQLADGMKRGNDFVSMIALFGWGRHTDRLNADHKPLTFREIDQESAAFAEFVANFDAHRPDIERLSYLIAPADGGQDLSYVDKWYARDAGEVCGKYVLYRLSIK
jgi:hypothetical protein